MEFNEVNRRIRSIRKKKSVLEKKESEIKAKYSILDAENARLQKEKDAVKEEILLLKGILGEMRSRAFFDPNSLDEDPLEGAEGGAIDGAISFERTLAIKDGEKTIIVDEKKRVFKLQSERKAPAPLSSPPHKRQIKTMLHSILDAVNTEGRVNSRALAANLETDEKTLMECAQLMERRGLLNINYGFIGSPTLEKPKV